MKEFTKSSLALLRSELNKALSSFQKDHNIKIDLGNIRYESDHCTVKLDCYIMKNDPNFDPLLNKLREDYLRYHESFLLKKEYLDQEFDLDGKIYSIVGLDIKKRQYPIIMKIVSHAGSKKESSRQVKVSLEYFKRFINQSFIN